MTAIKKPSEMPGTAGTDPVTGYPLPADDITVDEALDWISYLASESRRLERIISFQIRLGVGLAECLMALNEVDEHDKNRKMRPRWVDHLAQEEREGRWDVTGQPIIVARTGYMNDGQHRCGLVLTIGRPIGTVISFGPTRESRMKLDMGKKRSSVDHLDMKGERYAKWASAAARLLALYDRGLTITTNTSTSRDQASPASSRYLSTPAGTEFYAKVRDEIQDTINKLTYSRLYNSRGKLLQPSVAIAICIVLRRANDQAALTFMERLYDGLGFSSQSDPIYLTMRKLEAKQAKTPGQQFELLFRAWNYWRRGQSPSRINLLGEIPQLVQG